MVSATAGRKVVREAGVRVHMITRDAFLKRGVPGAALLCAGILLLAGAIVGSRDQSELSPYALKRGEVKKVELSGGHLLMTVEYRSGGPTDRIRLSPPELTARYSDLVRPFWSRPCSRDVGTQVRVAHLDNLPLAVLEGVKVRRGQSADPLEWRLCYIRLYFDFTASDARSSRETRHAAGIALGIVSDSDDPMDVWLRGPAAQVLASYDRPSWMTDAATRRGYAKLVDSVQPLNQLRAELGSKTVLVRVVPFRYDSFLEKPVGGGWPYFVIALFEDDINHGLVKIADYSAALDRLEDRPRQPQ